MHQEAHGGNLLRFSSLAWVSLNALVIVCCPQPLHFPTSFPDGEEDKKEENKLDDVDGI